VILINGKVSAIPVGDMMMYFHISKNHRIKEIHIWHATQNIIAQVYINVSIIVHTE